MAAEEIPKVSFMPNLKFLYTSRIEVAEVLSLGSTPYGQRRIINIKGGSFAGDGFSGHILPGGADWQIVRKDDIVELEARYTLQTHDGALIYLTNWGYRHGPPDVMHRLNKGEEVDPKKYYFRTIPKFESASSEYAWLNGVVAVAVGQRKASEVIITGYAVE